jgi:hypothetical protein
MKESYAKRPKCTKIKDDGKKCQALAVKGKERCYKHGGAVQSGAAASAFKTGKFSAVLPKNIVDRFEALLADRELVEHRSTAALFTIRAEEVLRELADEEQARAQTRYLKRYAQILSKEISKGEITKDTAYDRLTAAITKKMEEYQKWEEIYQIAELKRKTMEAETKRLKDMGAVMTMEQALAFIMSVSGIAKRYLEQDKMEGFVSEVGSTLKLALPAYKMVETVPVIDAVEGEIVDD